MGHGKSPASQPIGDSWHQIEPYVLRFEQAWQNGGPPAIDAFLPTNGPHRLAVLKELIHVDVERRKKAGKAARLEDYLERFPELASDPPSLTSPTRIVAPPSPDAPAAPPVGFPQQIGRYRIEKILGQGSFGIVYLAYDDQLSLPVAIKVPHRKLVPRAEDANPYLTEARIVAGLDHPNIVPVYDAGQSDEYPCFIVSKFIEGCTLAQRLRENRPSVLEAAELVATVAQTLHYAHRKGLVHRDIKPGKWSAFGVPDPKRLGSVESGQYVINKRLSWRPLKLAWFYNDHSDYYYRYGFGDKHTFEVAWARCGQPFVMWDRQAIWHDVAYVHPGPDRLPLFIHRCSDKFRFDAHAYTTTQHHAMPWYYSALPLERECWEWMTELARLTRRKLAWDRMIKVFRASGKPRRLRSPWQPCTRQRLPKWANSALESCVPMADAMAMTWWLRARRSTSPGPRPGASCCCWSVTWRKPPLAPGCCGLTPTR
jgi:hypothetical protein